MAWLRSWGSLPTKSTVAVSFAQLSLASVEHFELTVILNAVILFSAARATHAVGLSLLSCIICASECKEQTAHKCSNFQIFEKMRNFEIRNIEEVQKSFTHWKQNVIRSIIFNFRNAQQNFRHEAKKLQSWAFRCATLSILNASFLFFAARDTHICAFYVLLCTFCASECKEQSLMNVHIF